MRRSLLGGLVLAAACAPVTSSQPHMAHSGPPGTIVSTPLARTARTMSNQPLRLPQGAAELVAAAIVIPAGGATAIHQHPWSRFVYVERGPLRVINHDTGETRDFQSGQVLPEVIAQWHEGRAPAGAVRLIVIDLVPPGVNNMVMR